MKYHIKYSGGKFVASGPVGRQVRESFTCISFGVDGWTFDYDKDHILKSRSFRFLFWSLTLTRSYARLA